MDAVVGFDLPKFMFSFFPRIDFGGSLFHQAPMGLRFDIGLERVFRAVKIFEFAFGKEEDFILVSQDWNSPDKFQERSMPLFETPGILDVSSDCFKTVEVFPFDEPKYSLTWVCTKFAKFDKDLLFQTIANRERGRLPSIESGVYLIEPVSRIIMHMYDDRGLDIVATDATTLSQIYREYEEWILEYDRPKIVQRFKNASEYAKEQIDSLR